ncbi:MAG: TetR/AcrR family transcriptional regulator [Syntrophothermus sp.]
MAPRRRPEQGGEALPRGRHSLPREAVAAIQRARIRRAMVEVIGELGYPETRVLDVTAVAGVSRKTFYELFDSKEDCFLAIYDDLLGGLLADTNAAMASAAGANWSERAAWGMRAVLEHLARHPLEARFGIVEVLAAGPEALARRDAALRRFAAFLDAGHTGSSSAAPTIASLTVAGAVHELLYGDIAHGATAELPSRLPELMSWILLPSSAPRRA